MVNGISQFVKTMLLLIGEAYSTKRSCDPDSLYSHAAKRIRKSIDEDESKIIERIVPKCFTSPSISNYSKLQKIIDENYDYSKEGSINKISVIDASGKVTKAKNFLFFKKYPKVGPGSEIKVGYKEVKVKENIEGKESDVKWGEVLANSIAQATAILSIILLVQNVN